MTPRLLLCLFLLTDWTLDGAGKKITLATWARTRDLRIAMTDYSPSLFQLSYCELALLPIVAFTLCAVKPVYTLRR